jgi:LmbE family N-acetylglucosaminyl deacetylase
MLPAGSRTTLSTAVLLLWLGAAVWGQNLPNAAGELAPAQDKGIAGLEQALRSLRTTARLLHTTAHPDDEDGGMMTLEARGRGASVELLTLNRGEGGQNKFGNAFSDELGILRTLELLAADRYYGVDQRFTRVVDFGYSKTSEESFQKWGGHDSGLADLVRAIRTLHPDVLVSRFQGAARDGHGNHEAAGILTCEAFRAAADPQRFPEQLREGLLPWQAKKLYMDNVRPDEDYTLRLDTGAYDAALGMAYAQFGLEGLAHQTSQGVGGARLLAGHRYTYYKLIDSTLPPVSKSGAHEQDFFDGIDTSLSGLANRLTGETAAAKNLAEFLLPALQSLEKQVDAASSAFTPENPYAAAAPLLTGLSQVKQVIQRVEQTDVTGLSGAAKADLLIALRTKEQQFSRAANLAGAMTLEVSVDPPGGATAVPTSGFPRFEQTMELATAGETFTITERLVNRGREAVTAKELELKTPAGWQVRKLKQEGAVLQPGDSASAQFEVKVPTDAMLTRPYWHRSDPETQNVYSLDEPQYATLPLPPYPVSGHASYLLGGQPGEIEAGARVKYVDPVNGQGERPLVVGPAFSLEMEPAQAVFAIGTGATDFKVNVNVRNNMTMAGEASLRLQAPAGWRVKPQSAAVKLDAERTGSYAFTVTPTPGEVREKHYGIQAHLEYSGRDYAEGYSVVSRPDLGAFYYYRPATLEVSAIEVKVAPRALKIGYVMGAGDSIPAVLDQLGLDVKTITTDELTDGNLNKYDTIVVGIRAYDVRPEVREQNRCLLEYVRQGGTLLVQYNQNLSAFNAGHYTPYPATESNERVSVEEAPVAILAPSEAVFHYPNQVQQRDFDHWVQERGLYFMGEWDQHFIPLLSSHDPGEGPLNGGLLEAHYGNGIYIYCGYAFFRQLPAGVPGAIRLFVNLLNAGHETSATK